MKRNSLFNIGTVHIVGIGGIGMSGYAEILQHMGYKVQGSDISENANVNRLKKIGIRINIGHSKNNIYDETKNLCSVVVKSTAIKDDNIEIIEAIKKNISVIPRVELLAEIMRGKWCINISGTHGKTTTTSIIGQMLEDNEFDPTIINGGIINSYESNVHIGNSKWMVVEADESDGTFTKLPSIVSVITNIDSDHLDYYKNFEILKEAFILYANNVNFYGFIVVCVDDPVVAELIPQFKPRVITYGFSEGADIRAVNIKNLSDGVLYDLEFRDNMNNFLQNFKDIKLPMSGKHNILNSLTAFAIGLELGLDVKNIALSLAKTSGVKRRFTKVAEVNDITIIDDYAHHPIEIKAVLESGRDILNNKNNSGKLIAVFQPHRYTRVKSLFNDFCKSFEDADIIIVTDIYEAGEEPIAGINKEAISSGIKKQGKDKIYMLKNPESLAIILSEVAKPKDLVICMGAGSISNWAYKLPQELNDIFNGII